MVDTEFSKIQIFYLKPLILSLATDTPNCFPWSDKFTSSAFEKMFSKYSGLNTHSISHSFEKIDALWEKNPANSSPLLTVRTGFLQDH